MSGTNLMNLKCECEPNADGTCACDVEEIHLSCHRSKLTVLPEKPAVGELGTTYFIGNNESGYEEWAWTQAGSWLQIGTATATTINPMTVDTLGLGRLSTSTVVHLNGSEHDSAGAIGINNAGQLLAVRGTNNTYGTYRLSTSDTLTTTTSTADLNLHGGAVGTSESGQLVAQSATRERYGTVRLGSMYYVFGKGSEYIVGLGISGSDGTKGQLCFALADKQVLSSGAYSSEAGCLRFRKIPNEFRVAPDGGTVNTNMLERDGAEYEMYVTTASATQMGVVKMVESFSAYSDAELTAMRDTHVPSVGCVVDYLRGWTEKWINDNAKDYLYAWYCDQTGLTEELWALYSDTVVENVEARLIVDMRFLVKVQAYTNEKTTEWLTANVTDTYLDGLFGGRIDSLAKQYWNDDIDANIQLRVAEKVSADFQAELTTHLSKSENVTRVAMEVVDEVKSVIAEDDEFTSGLIIDVMSGKEKVELGGVLTTVPEYIDQKISTAVKAYEAELAALKARVNTTHQRAWYLTTNYSYFTKFTTYNPASRNDGPLARGIPTSEIYTTDISLPPGIYLMRVSSTPKRALEAYDEANTYRIKVKATSGNRSFYAYTNYYYWGDWGKANDEKTQGVTSDSVMVTVDESGVVSLSVEYAHTTNEGGLAECVAIEFI